MSGTRGLNGRADCWLHQQMLLQTVLFQSMSVATVTAIMTGDMFTCKIKKKTKTQTLLNA